MLIETAEGVLNTAHIATAESVANASDQRSLIAFADGTKKSFGIGIWELEQSCGAIVPAQPGFTVIRALLPDADEKDTLYIEEPVIAFRIMANGPHDGPMPITVSGEPNTVGGSTLWTVRQPNGRCFGPPGDHDTLDEFKAYCKRASQLSRARRIA